MSDNTKADVRSTLEIGSQSYSIGSDCFAKVGKNILEVDVERKWRENRLRNSDASEAVLGFNIYCDGLQA